MLPSTLINISIIFNLVVCSVITIYYLIKLLVYLWNLTQKYYDALRDGFNYYYDTHQIYNMDCIKPILLAKKIDKNKRRSWITGYRKARTYYENEVLKKCID